MSDKIPRVISAALLPAASLSAAHVETKGAKPKRSMEISVNAVMLFNLFASVGFS